MQRIIELGADYYLLKPFNLDVLIKRIRQLAGVPEANGGSSEQSRLSVS